MQGCGFMQTLTFILGGNEFGIPLEDVEHVEERANNIMKLPTAPPYIKGLVTVRSEVVPVYNLALRFGYTEKEIRYLIIVIAEGMKIGLEVDRVNGVIDVEEQEIFPLPFPLNEIQQYLFKNIVVYHQKRIIILLNVNDLMIEKEKIHQLMTAFKKEAAYVKVNKNDMGNRKG